MPHRAYQHFDSDQLTFERFQNKKRENSRLIANFQKPDSDLNLEIQNQIDHFFSSNSKKSLDFRQTITTDEEQFFWDENEKLVDKIDSKISASNLDQRYEPDFLDFLESQRIETQERLNLMACIILYIIYNNISFYHTFVTF